MSTAVSGIHHLETRILELERLQAQQTIELKASVADILDSISPSNMLKSALKDVVQSPDLRNTAINTAIGIGAGLLGEKLYVGGSKNIFKRISGSALQFLIANFVRKKIPGMQKNNLQHDHEN
ncbi:MAG TPA: hypothetical protein VK483_10260 [Chitinophagaceae bacterium]|nr:hypothetical protein [Chitinophagaceae bacterium]